MKKIIWLIIIIVIIVIILVVAGNRKPVEAQMVSVGVPMPLTGVRADAGEFSKNALTLAEEEINSNKDLTYKLKFIYEDTKYEPPVAVSAVRKLLDLDQVHYFIGPYGSSEVMAAAPIADQAKAIMFLTGAQSEEISQLGDYIFRVIHNTAQEAPIFARFIASKASSDTLHFLAINTAVTDPYLKTFRPVFESAGKKIGLVEKFDPKATDYKTELTKIKSQNPTDILLIAAPKQTGLILKQADDLGLKVQFYGIGVEGPDIVTVAGPLAEGLLYPYSYDNHGAEPEVKAFYAKYVERFGGEPDTLAANSYDVAYLLSVCLEKNGDDVEKVKMCLYETKDFKGASGTFSIDSNGDAVKPIFIKTIKDGKFVKLEE